jgi:CubicO group peptidase (beta-lactamase class C family)
MLKAIALASVISFSAKDLEQIRAKYNVPALGAAMLQNGTSEVFITGERKFKSSVQAQSQDQFHLGSCTKAMTATLTAVLVERGLIRWDQTLAASFPELSNTIHAKYKTVTLEMLSSHRSGITGDLQSFQNGLLWKKLWEPQLNAQQGRKLTAQVVLAAAPSSEPGTHYEYSNINYMLLGLVLEKASRKDWQALMKEELFSPLGMTSCGFGPQANPLASPPDQPWPHLESKDGPVPVTPDSQADNPSALGPAGTVHCSMQDWLKFAQLHIDGYNNHDTKIAKAKTLAHLYQAPVGQDYTYGGWIKADRAWAGGASLSHAGSNTMNYANIWLAPKKFAAIIAVTNMGGDTGFKATDAAVSGLVNNVKP